MCSCKILIYSGYYYPYEHNARYNIIIPVVDFLQFLWVLNLIFCLYYSSLDVTCPCQRVVAHGADPARALSHEEEFRTPTNRLTQDTGAGALIFSASRCRTHTWSGECKYRRCRAQFRNDACVNIAEFISFQNVDLFRLAAEYIEEATCIVSRFG